MERAAEQTILLHGGRIYRSSFDPAPASAVLLRGDRIAWVGQAEDAPAADRAFDLEGASVVPGLTDPHIHLFTLALARHQIAFAALQARSLEDVHALLKRHATRFGQGEWVQGCELNEDMLAERRLPHRAELDAVFPDRPVLLRRYCGHAAVFNSAAMQALGLRADEPDPPFGHFERDEGGALNGVAYEQAAAEIFRKAPAPDPVTMAEGIRTVISECLDLGLTALTEAAVGFVIGYEREAEVWELLRRAGNLPVRMSFMTQLTAEEAASHGLSPQSGPDWSTDTLKFFADGIVGGRTAALSQPFLDRGGYGTFMLPEEVLTRQLVAAHAAGWRIAVHATGDRAIARVVESYELAQRARPRPDPRHRIEHCFVPPQGIFPRIAALGAQVVMQPSFVWGMGRSAAAGLGPERMQNAYPGRSVLQAGATLVFSSDAPTGSISPWRGMQTAVERRSAQGAVLGSGEALSRAEALSAYVEGGAFAMRHEAFRGGCVPGAAADLVVLDRDPFTCDAQNLHAIRSVLTVTRGTPAGAGARLLA